MLTMVAARLNGVDLAKLDRLAEAMGGSSRSAAMRLLIREAREPDGPLFLARPSRNRLAAADGESGPGAVVPAAGAGN